jgi:hypothetical protein
MLNDRKKKPSCSGKKIRGHYVNYFEVGHNAFEFVFDFGQFYPESKETDLCARIITSPGCAKELFIVLGESIEQYIKNFESLHGE